MHDVPLPSVYGPSADEGSSERPTSNANSKQAARGRSFGSWAWRWEFRLLFVLVATANGAGYRYGMSDQAFYIPVVVRALEPAAFPHDASLIDSQGRLMLADEVLATLVRVTGLPLDVLFLVAYLVSLLLIWIALVAIGRRMYPSAWLTVALAAAFTLRHRIPRTSANSFEPYFHPRMLAFGVGALAVAALLRRRFWLAIGLVAFSGFIHVTTGLWFAVLVGVAIARLDRNFRRLAVGGAIAACRLPGLGRPRRSASRLLRDDGRGVAGGGRGKGFAVRLGLAALGVGGEPAPHRRRVGGTFRTAATRNGQHRRARLALGCDRARGALSRHVAAGTSRRWRSRFNCRSHGCSGWSISWH